MLRRRIWWAGVIAGVVGLAFYFLPARKPEPSYEGRSLSEWLKVAAWADGREVSEATVKPDEAFAAMGTNMIPFLLDWLEEKPSAFGDYVERLREDRGWQWIPLWATSWWQRQRSESSWAALTALGAAGETAIPRLVRLVHDPDPTISKRAQGALYNIGPPAIPALVQILSDPGADLSLHSSSVRNLGSVIADAPPGVIPAGLVTIAATALIENLGDTNEFIATRAAIGLIGVKDYESQHERCIAALSGALKDPRLQVRWFAVLSLVAFGTHAVPALRLALQDENRSLREMASEYLRWIDPQALGNGPIR